ncbi:hypothetical protein Xcel_2516 [Xylanimonas cellulosilytica DSM 15894]|uniref:Protein-glutamine gamma-glutamyltransferase-like C-terminal domain-containing protein n=1 Tax=Xylanimonas cellulosilytica (strain DSM 15894 / JCM 12276 / CECT 5975 / KCTC 9989 / LMG 20990 / NBRC 107835 / XIL07) TaxID=446471 RepID=D1BWI6_XYLCX|nr:DUF4129 domain-containing protein [Xylanimonas cellulosilytica]ACZ31531.1 hypothetical protein Xcel_2516 [Xylanimonas cellulosilytica DSM 15894]
MQAAALVALVGADVPVTPDRETARRWLVEELARPEYATQPSLLQRLWEWFTGLFDGLQGLDAPPWQVLAGIVAVAALVIVVSRWVAGPVRLARRRRGSAVVTASDDARTAAQLRAAADAAAARGDWPLAVTERFRAVVRSLEDRTILDERPGRTAQEAAADAGDRLPAHATALAVAATLFDGVLYGHRGARESDDAALRELDAHLAAARVVGVEHAARPSEAPAHPDANGGPA